MVSIRFAIAGMFAAVLLNFAANLEPAVLDVEAYSLEVASRVTAKPNKG